MFPGRVAVLWSLHSPDLSPCDIFLWGYLKAKVLKHRPQSLDQLKAIQKEIEGISPNMLVRVMESFQEQLDTCTSRQGHHLNDIIFKACTTFGK